MKQGDLLDYNLESELSKLQLVLTPSREPIVDRDIYNKSYTLWRRVWSHTFSKLEGIKYLPSDHFTRHDFIASILRLDSVIATISFSIVDFALDARKDDSSFKAWPKEILSEINGRCLHPALLSVAPEFRKSSNYPVNISQQMMNIYAMLVVEYDCILGLGTARNNRSVNTLMKNAGGTKVGQAIDYNVDVDLILMTNKGVREALPAYGEVFHKLWNRRIDHWRDRSRAINYSPTLDNPHFG